jgi:hypothetical protein
VRGSRVLAKLMGCPCHGRRGAPRARAGHFRVCDDSSRGTGRELRLVAHYPKARRCRCDTRTRRRRGRRPGAARWRPTNKGTSRSPWRAQKARKTPHTGRYQLLTVAPACCSQRCNGHHHARKVLRSWGPWPIISVCIRAPVRVDCREMCVGDGHHRSDPRAISSAPEPVENAIAGGLLGE